MVLNYIWIAFFLIGFVVALIKFIFFGDVAIFPEMLEATFKTAKAGFEISIGLTGVMTLWLGLMKIGERGGIIPILSKLVGPFFSRLFPEIPKDHPAIGSIIMNFSGNILGLDNAATPLGLKAMKELQEINPNPDTASNAQLMFLVLNASGLTVIPISVIADRVTLGSANPTSIFIPTLLATFCSTLGGLTYMCIRQRIKLLDPVLLAYIFGFMAAIGGAVAYFATLSKDELQRQSTLFASVIILTIIVSFITLGFVRRINVFDAFIEGAKEGFSTAIKVIPYLVAILVAVAIFRTSGTLDAITGGIKWTLLALGVNADFVDALPVAFLKPLSGQGARAMMLDISDRQNFGPDSFVGNLSAIFRGCAETTLYLVALYFGSISVRNTRYAVTGGLIADACGAIAAIFIAYAFFH